MSASSSADGPPISNVVVDPRLRARRIAVRKDAGRRRLHRLVVLVAIAVLALASVIVLRSPVFDVDEVDVVGARATGSEAVTEAAGIGLGSPLLLADLDAAERAVEALPWVEEATVERDLPGGVHIDIVERSPAAVVAVDADAVLVDSEGRVLAPADPASLPESVEAFPPFVRVVVPEAATDVGGRVDTALLDAIALAERLRANPANVVAAVHVAPELRLELASGATVELGDAEGIDAKVEAFRTIHARVDQACVTVIDLRVPTRPVLTRDESCS